MEIKSTLVLDSKEPLSKAISELTDSGTAVIVTKKGKYFGTIDDRSLGHGFMNNEKTPCETVITKPPTLLPKADLLERVDAFLLGHYKALPIVDADGYALGITTRVELLQDMMKERLMPKSKVSEMMSAPVYTIEEIDNLAAAKSLMKRNRCSRLVVVRRSKPIGIISTLDLAAERAFHRQVSQKKPYGISEVKSLDSLKIKEFFRPDIAVVGEADTAEDAAKRMIKNKVSSV
ncbi:MAG: CBS domain-containing protein, partial [Candidatus Micrarchaeota archaeon]